MKKVISIMLTVVMLFSMAFTATVFADGETATVTCNSLTGDYLNGYDGYLFSEWSSNSGAHSSHKNAYNFFLDNSAFTYVDSTLEGDALTAASNINYGKKSVYMRFKVSDFADSNISSARTLFAYHGNHANQTLKMYFFDESLWNTERAPIVERTAEKMVSFKTPAKVNSAIVPLSDENIQEGWTYYAAVDITEKVKAAVENDDEYLCFVLDGGGAYGTFYAKDDANKPRLQVFTTVPDPDVSLSADKESYKAGDDIVITATTEHVAQDATVSYTFTVNDEVKAGVDNVLTIADAEEGEYVVKVTCNDGTNTFEDTITITVAQAGPVITANSLTGDYLNGYDGYLFSEWTYNKGGNGTNASNFYLDGRAFTYVDSTLEGDALTAVSNLSYGKKSVYMRFKVDDYKNANVSSARLLLSYNRYLSGGKMNIFTFDDSLWNTTTAPTVERTEATLTQFTAPSTGSQTHAAIVDQNFEEGWEYYAIVDLSDVVKTAIANDEEYVCLVLEPNTSARGTFFTGDATKPRLQIFTSSNKIPTATLTANPDKASYLSTDEVVLTAEGTDLDEDAVLTYTFYVNDEEITEGVDGNVLTLSNLEAGNNVVKVKVTDQWGDYGVATKTLFVKGTPVKTYNTVEGDKYNSYDGKVFTEYNNVTNHNQTYNYVLNNNDNKLVLFTRFKVSDYKNANISSARLLSNMGSGLKGKTINVYKFDEDLWSDTVGPVVDRSDANIVDSVALPSGDYTYLSDEGIGSNWTYNTQFDITSAVKEAIANGDEYICLTIENASAGWSTFANENNKHPRIQIVTTTNNIPTVSVKADKLTYKEGDSVVLTATGADSDVDSSLTYKFYVDGVEATEGVNGNKLTISNYDGLEHNVTVKCFDEWNDYGVAAIVVKKNMAFEIAAVASGSIETVLSANYQVKNMDTVNPIDATVIIAVYDASGALYDTVFSTSQVGAGQTATLGATLTPKALPEGNTFDGYTAQAMIWTSKTLIPLWECVDFE